MVPFDVTARRAGLGGCRELGISVYTAPLWDVNRADVHPSRVPGAAVRPERPATAASRIWSDPEAPGVTQLLAHGRFANSLDHLGNFRPPSTITIGFCTSSCANPPPASLLPSSVLKNPPHYARPAPHYLISS